MSEHDPELSPEDEARVQALLADLGDAPDAELPPEVAARLDETLAGLVAERADEPAAGSATVVPLRRRWASRTAAAAAAVIVVGVGGVAIANLGGSGDDAMSGGATSSDAGGAQSQPSTEEAPSAESGGGSAGDALVNRDLPVLSAASFEADVTDLVVDHPAALREYALDNQRQALKDQAGGDAAAVGACAGPKVRDGARHLVVLYDGSPAALVVHPVKREERIVEAWTCTGDRMLDSTTVPASTRPTSGTGDPGSGSPSPSP